MVRNAEAGFQLVILGCSDSLLLPRCLSVLGPLVPKQHRIDFCLERSY